MHRACRAAAARAAVAILPAAAAAILPAVARADPPSLHQLVGAPPQLKLTLATRMRYETLEGQPRAGLNPTDEQLALRTNLVLEYADGPWRIGGELQDSRAWLGKAGSALSTTDVNTLEPVQAYLGLDLANRAGKLMVEAGRFTFNLGSRRFLASDDYRNATSAYTGLRADLKARSGTAATLFYVLPQQRLPDDLPALLANRPALDKESLGLRFFGVLASKPGILGGIIPGTGEVGIYRLVEHDSPGHATRDRHLTTISARLFRDAAPGHADFDVEAAWQTGRASAGTAALAALQPVKAGMVHAGLGWTFPGPARLRAGLFYDWMSGDAPGGANTRFDTLFGGRRFEFAPAGILAVIGRANISSPGLRLEAAPGKRFDAMAVYRPMWLANRADSFSQTGVIDRTGASGRFAGHNVDLRARYWLVPARLRAEVDYDWIGKGRFLRTAPNAPPTGDTHYASFALTASL